MCKVSMKAAVLAASAGVLLGGVVRADVFAGKVIEYVPGAVGADYQDPSAALGPLNPITGVDPLTGEGEILTPFNAAYQGSQMVGIGQGGHLTLQLSSPVPVGNGPSIGVHAGVGLYDYAYPNGRSGDGSAAEPLSYNDTRQSLVSVSADGSNWVSLGQITFDVPSNYYTDDFATPAAQTAPGKHAADFAKPFTGTLGDFASKDYAGVLSVLDGSAGGTWLDLSGTGLSSVDYVRFDEPDAETMYVDAIAAVPEPTGIAIISLAALWLGRRRR